MSARPTPPRLRKPANGTVLIAPDKFKGSLTATEVATYLEHGIRSAAPDLVTECVPVADGGEGTLDVAVSSGFARIPVTATGPTGVPIEAAIAIRGRTAVIELAAASGLDLLPGRIPDPLRATSRGVGDLIRAALDQNCTSLILAIGGSATTDGGAGLLQGLGVRLLDDDGAELPGGGAALQRLAAIDTAELDPRLAAVELILATDVDNPLLGENGCVAVYAEQKGANRHERELLESALTRWARLLDPDAAALPGSGAAGGVGYAALAVLSAVRRPGAELVLDLIDFEAKLERACLVVIGEGHMDRQSLHGKAPFAVAAAASKRGVPVVAVNGGCTLDAAALSRAGVVRAYALTDLEPDRDRCIRHAHELLVSVGQQLVADMS